MDTPTWNKGKHLSEEHRRKISESNRGKIHIKGEQKFFCKKCSKEVTRYNKSGLCLSCNFKEKYARGELKIAIVGKLHTLEQRRKISEGNKGKKMSIEARKKMSAWQIGRKMPLEAVERSRQKHIGRKQSEEEKQLRSQILKKYNAEHPELKEYLSERKKQFYAQHPERIKQILRRREMSSLEKKAQEIISSMNLPYKFVGNGDFIIGRKCPDFININGQKIAVEVYCRKHKDFFRGGTEKWKDERMKIFAQYGWTLLFFDERDVNVKTLTERLGEKG